MAFSNNARPLTNFAPTTSTDSKSNGVPINQSFGSTNRSWGSGNIWASNGSLSNGVSTRATTRDNSSSRPSTGEADTIGAKTGSGLLVDSSITDDNISATSTWASKPNWSSARSTSQARFPESAAQQQRSASNAGLASTFTQNLSTFGSRPGAINLTSNSSLKSYNPSSLLGMNGRSNDQPPKVYTKLDRPLEPNLRKQPDSAKGLWSDSSPTEDRKFPYWTAYGNRTASMPSSRNGSLPPSRNGSEQPLYTSPEYSRASQQRTNANSRAPSISSQSTHSYTNGAGLGADQLTQQFNQMSMNGDSRPHTSYKSSLGSNSIFSHAPTSSGASQSSRSALNGIGYGFDGVEEAEDVDRMNMSYSGYGGYTSPLQAQTYPDYATTALGNRYMQSAAGAGNLAQNHLYASGNLPVGNYDIPTGPRSTANWQSMTNGTLTAPRKSPSEQGQTAYLDPHMQQMLVAAHLRNAYPSMYNPYTSLPNGLQLGATAPFVPAMDMYSPDLLGADTQGVACQDIQSALMWDFKTNTRSKRFELMDIYNHIAEFAGDQHGSRFIQTKLETANSDEKDRVFSEIQPNAIQLMTDVFGNYVIQKFFEHGDQTHKKILANKMRGQVLTLSLQMYGCRVVQKALDHVLIDQQAQLVSELETHVLKCVKDQNGNHVIQKAIERCPSETIRFIIDAFRGQVQHLSIHPYGCRVIQRCLERCDSASKAMIMNELMDNIQSMISDQYGNYVVQHVVEHDDGEAKKLVLNIVSRRLEDFSKHKFASNVVEKCLQRADDVWRRSVIFTIANGDQRRCEGDGLLVLLIKDGFGNYVIQKLLDTLCQPDYMLFLDLLQPAMSQAKRSGSGKQVMSIEKKMGRFQTSSRNIPGNYNGGYNNSGLYGMPLPTPPFASNYGSAANTPPPLTTDSQSLQSSRIPSINGDAVEGAQMSLRKGSEPNNDAVYLR